MDTLKSIGVGLATLVLVGAGCANNTSEPTKPTEANKQAPVSAPVDDQAAGEPKNAGLVVENKTNTGVMISKAEAKGAGSVLVEFTVTDEVKKDAEAYRLLLSTDTMPEWPTKGHWYELGKDHMIKEWKGLPLGKRNLRVCVVKKDVCAMYSEVVPVDVK